VIVSSLAVLPNFAIDVVAQTSEPSGTETRYSAVERS